MKLRTYQYRIIEETKNQLSKKDNIIITLGMGGGKSLIISELVDLYLSENKKIVVLVNITELVQQLEDYLKIKDIDYGVIKSKEDYISGKKVYIIMEQSFYESKRSELMLKTDILLKDEFHIGFNGKRYKDIIKSLSPKKIIGLTGTPYDQQGYLLEGFEKEDLITYGSTYELTKNGFLTPLKYYIPQWSMNQDYNKIKTVNNDYKVEELDNIINKTDFLNLTVESMEQMNSKSKKTLVYCNTISHVKNLTKILKKNGYRAVEIHSQKTNKENKENIILFEHTNKVNCLVSVSKLTTGFNQPSAELLVLCRPTKILRLYLQIIFRVARLHENKSVAEVLDLSQCVSYHGIGTKQPNYNLLKKEKRKINQDKEIEIKIRKEAIKEILKENNGFKEVKENEIQVKIKELRIREIDINNTKTNELMRIFENTWDIEIAVSVYYELNKRINGINYKDEDIMKELSVIKPLFYNNNDKKNKKSKPNDKKSDILKKMKVLFKNKIKENSGRE